MLPTDHWIDWTRVRALALALAGALLLSTASGATAQELPVTEVAFVYRFPSAPVATSHAEALPSILRRRLTLTLHRVTLERALREITARARLDLSYSRAIVPLSKVVSVAVENGTTAEALRQVLKGIPVEFWIARNGKAALVPPTSEAIVASTGSGSIAGQVTDTKTRDAIAGAELWLDGTRWRATTDTSGGYLLADVDPGTYLLIVRRLGYVRQSRKVTVRDQERKTVDLALEPAAIPLNDLVATATGQQRRRDLGNAITTIHADSSLQSAPIRSLTDLLENRVPGMSVQHTSGAPGDPARLRLRGIGSVLRSNDPVVIVDGVRIYAAQSGRRSGNLTNAGGGLGVVGGASINPGNTPAPSPLDQIDPNIIDKVEVFKGPSAATLYGADAANGVIVVTTKRGRPGPTRWDVRMHHGQTSTLGRYPEGYYRFGHVPLLGGFTVFCPLAEVRCVADSLVRYQTLNDPDFTVLGRGYRTGGSLTASGGSRALTYSVTGTYDDEIGLLTLPEFEANRFRTRFNREAPDWMRRPHHLKKWSVTNNVTALLNQTTDITLSTTLSRSEQERTSIERQLGALAGTYVDGATGAYYTPGSTEARGPGGLGYMLSSRAEFLREYYKRSTASSINFTTGLSANWRPAAWFTGTGQAGINVIPRDDQFLLPGGLLAPTDSGALIRGTGRSLVSTFNLQGGVRKPLWRGLVFKASVGANLTNENITDLISSAMGLVPGTTSLAGARSITSTDDQRTTSVFGWYIEPSITGERFALSTGIRLDGGSTYGTRLTGMLGLPKFNGSWVVSEETWFPFKSIFSSLRLRGAYGQAQVQPGVADRLRLYRSSANAAGEQLDLATIGNTHLKPERSVEFEGGFDADLFQSRVTLEVTGYRKTQQDALLPTELPGSVNGGGSVITNIGNIRNTGVELTLGVTPIRHSALTWNTQLNYSHNNNLLVKLGRGVAPNPGLGLVEGYPVNGRWALPIMGFADANGNGILERTEVQVGDSLVYMGRLLPGYETSLHTNIALLGGAIRISAGFAYDAGGMQVDETGRTNWVLARPLVDPSTPLVEQAAVLALDSTIYGTMQDVSTFRFKSVSVNYRVPKSITHALRAQGMTIALQGDNLALKSTYRGKDPDVNAWSPGEAIIDTGQLPMPRTWQLVVFLQY